MFEADSTLPTLFAPSGHCRTCDGYAEHFAWCQDAPVPAPHCTCGSRLGCYPHGPAPREHAVTCWCGTTTWAYDGLCDLHAHPALFHVGA